MEPATSARIDNAEWVSGLSAGRADLVAALRERLRRGLQAALAGRSEVTEADLEDFTQDAASRVLQRLDSFRGDSAFTTWAMAIAVRVALTALRRRRWDAETVGQRLSEFAGLAPAQNSPAAVGARSELLGTLRSLIADHLTPRQRTVLLGELDGIPQILLAEHLGAKPGAIYKVAHDARKKLKTLLEERGYDAHAVSQVLAGVD